MADTFKTIKITQAIPGGPLDQQLVGAVQTSVGAADAGKVVLLNSAGQLDPSMGGGGGGSTIYVNGVVVTSPSPNLQNSASVTWSVSVGGGFSNIQATVAAGSVTSVFGRAGAVTAQTGDYTVAQVTGAAPLASPTFTGLLTEANVRITGTLADGANSVGTPGFVLSSTGSGTAWVAQTGGSSSFSSITSGVNSAATMTVNTGASIIVTGTGVVEATQLWLVVISSTPPTTGQVLTATSPTAANWQTPGGGGGSSRTTAVITTASLNPNAVESGTVALAKTFSAIKVVVNVPSRLRLYSTTGARDADVNRPPDVPPDPATQNGVIIDIVLNANTGVSWILNPTAVGDDGQNVPTGIIGYNVNNSSGVAQSVVWTITYLPMET